MTDRKQAMSKARKFCLNEVKKGPKTARHVAISGRDKGLNTARHWGEWADKHFLWLRNQGLIEKTGQKQFGAAVHRITSEGEEALIAKEDA